MTTTPPLLSVDEAIQLLGLTGAPPFKKSDVEQAFVESQRRYTKMLNCPRKHEDRDQATAALAALPYAKDTCISTKRQRAVSSTGNVASQTTWPNVHRPRSTIHLGTLGKHFAGVFVNLWECLCELFQFVVSIPKALGEAKSLVCDVLDQVQAAGIPKVVAVLVLILGFLPLINGCVQVIHKMAGWFK